MFFQNQWNSILTAQRSSIALGIFRIAFLTIVLFHYIKIFDRINAFKNEQAIRFPYPELDWVPMFSHSTLYVIAVVGVLATGLALVGLLFRPSMIIATLSFTYLNALDALYYNNHYYLIVLLCFLMCFVKADDALSLSALKKEKRAIPFWNYFILQLQIVIVFLYGGISKLNADWLSGATMGMIEKGSWEFYVLIWGGMIFDLFIGFLLLHRRTRTMAMILVLIFNISNHFLFDDIAAFPLLAIASLLVFMEGSHLPKWFGETPKTLDKLPSPHRAIISTLLIYFVFQFAYPLRHYAIPGHVDWTGQGHYFAWRMKSYQKNISLDFYAFDRTLRKPLYKINTGMDAYRIQRIGAMPHMLLPVARQLKSHLTEMDGLDHNIGISADYKVAFNERGMAAAIKTSIDLTQVTFHLYQQNLWIMDCPTK